MSVKKQKTAIVLGGTAPHALLCEKLKARGFKVVLIDWGMDPIAAKASDEHVRESTLDKEAVLSIARDRQADLVIASCVDQANSVCCYVAEQLELPHPYSHEISLDATDKGRMKALFQAGSIPSSAFQVFEDMEALRKSDFDFPVVVKPVDSNSSKGVHRADDKMELETYAREAFLLSRAGRVIVEGYCSGEEVQVDCICVNGEATVLLARSKMQLEGDGVELNSRGSIAPAAMTAAERELTAQIAQRICDSFNLRNTPFFYQAKLEEGKIAVLEFAPRIGGGLSTWLIELASGIDVMDASIDSYLEQTLDISSLKRSDKVYGTLLLYMKPGIFDHIEGLSLFEASGAIEFATVLKNRGSVVGPELSSGNRVATVIVSANDYNELETCCAEIMANVEVFNSEGEPCMIKPGR